MWQYQTILLTCSIADIQQLPRAETVCQFCGVSYLVHHEIKRLEDAVESMKGELTRYKAAFCFPSSSPLSFLLSSLSPPSLLPSFSLSSPLSLSSLLPSLPPPLLFSFPFSLLLHSLLPSFPPFLSKLL